MILKNGKFYDSTGQVVPLEFGNWEQIQLLERRKGLQEDGEFCVSEFTCLCGTPIERDMDKKKERKHCVVCGEEFEFYWHIEKSTFFQTPVPAVRMLVAK